MSVTVTLPVLQISPENATSTPEPVEFTVAVQAFDTVIAGEVEASQLALPVLETGPLPSTPVPLAVMVSLFDAVLEL